eukprot:SAG25_NODE_9988_length_349_cov_1.228000_1_plen_63_part_10
MCQRPRSQHDCGSMADLFCFRAKKKHSNCDALLRTYRTYSQSYEYPFLLLESNDGITDVSHFG